MRALAVYRRLVCNPDIAGDGAEAVSLCVDGKEGAVLKAGLMVSPVKGGQSGSRCTTIPDASYCTDRQCLNTVFSRYSSVHIHDRTGLHVEGHISGHFIEYRVVIRRTWEIQSGRYFLIRLIPVLGLSLCILCYPFFAAPPCLYLFCFFHHKYTPFPVCMGVSIDLKKCYGIINNSLLKVEMFHRK